MFAHSDVTAALEAFGLPTNASLSILAVEMYAGITLDGKMREVGIPAPGTPPAQWPAPPDVFDAQNLGRRRIVRTSALTPIAPIC